MRLLLAQLMCIASTTIACADVSLDFSNNVVPTDSNFAQLGDYISSTSPSGGFTSFEEVAPGIDAQVTGFVVGSGHTYVGLFPDFQNDNLGFLYNGVQDDTLGGIQVTVQFFESDGIVNGLTQLATPRNLSSFELTFHDIDGEPTQTEYLQAFLADGLNSYQVSQVDPLQVANNDVVYQFRGNGVNLDEDDASGATILRYIDTSSVTVNLFAQTVSGAPNLVFQAIDGDGDTHDRSAFAPRVFVAAPEPSSAMLTFVLAMSLISCRKQRRV